MAAHIRRRLRKGATTTAVAAAAVAALAASQAPAAPLAEGATGGDQQAAGGESGGPEDGAATGNSPYYTDLPPLITPDRPGSSSNLPAATGSAEAGIPASVLAAYKQAERTVATTDPACRLPWQLLAAIGKVESGQARGGQVDANGTTLSPILGPALNGQGFALIKDTDGGAYDSDAVHDRAVGPMQFIPSTWATWGQDANGDGRKDPNNIYDAALAAGRYLCAGGRNLAVAADLDRAVLSYNQSTEYLRTVRSWFAYYQRGTHEVPDGSGVLPTAPSTPTPSPTPTPTPSPTPGGTTGPTPSPSPSTPGGAKPSPSPSKPGDGSTSPTPTPTPPRPTPPPKPTPSPAETFGSLENAGTGPLTATAGGTFEERVSVRARNALGAPMAQLPVTFTITGTTGTLFDGGKKKVTVISKADGTATAPALKAGEKTGEFTVTATAGTNRPRTLTYEASVTARQADKIVRVGDKALVAAPGEKFADAVTVKATHKGIAAPGVAVTATMVKDSLGLIDNDKGPYFKDADGKPLRTLDLTTGADGLLQLPEIFADENPGTYKLRLTTEGGGSVVIELTVQAPEETAPEETETPEA
ncbi:Secreted protein [Streptomyces sp. CBMAI 2042]|uniref:lytic transglycosylase domain-containing protein n=1 Tax=Streptomyces sp. CBMAI 2042 TaxID=2305222 RepID=UPI000F1FE7D0|nr:lytic transglycosylase domain-containing protein [Streptomyces sp. CBMAI 2042]RLV65885.1 Secreted protein [Streptomyces sp. CBMAI 2042]